VRKRLDEMIRSDGEEGWSRILAKRNACSIYPITAIQELGKKNKQRLIIHSRRPAEGQPKTPDRTLRPRKPKPVHTPNPGAYGWKAREQPQPLRLLPDAALEGSRTLPTSMACTESD
jgi:hypothetical protein